MEFLNKFLGVDVRGQFLGVVHMVVVLPLDQVVNGSSHLLRVQDVLNFENFLAINDFGLGNGIT